jgi:polyketide biosynthesis acyl carrier protein
MRGLSRFRVPTHVSAAGTPRQGGTRRKRARVRKPLPQTAIAVDIRRKGDFVEQEIFAVVKSCILEVVPDVKASAIAPNSSMRDLGANSVDRMEVVTLAMERLKVKIPVVEFTNVSNIGQLVQVYCRALAGARG